MNDIGKRIRMSRLYNKHSRKFVIVPMDHGISQGPINGLINMEKTINSVSKGGANAIVCHKGCVKAYNQKHTNAGLIVHLSASTSLSEMTAKTIICTVEEAISFGADAVSIHVNIGDINEQNMLYDFGKISRKAKNFGLPLLVMIYPNGKEEKDRYNVNFVKHSARVAAEMGADIVKISYTGSLETFKEVVSGCSAPVLIAGGPKMNSDFEILKMVKDSIDAGGAGVSIGRNIFQHVNPMLMVKAISSIVHENNSLATAVKFIENKIHTNDKNICGVNSIKKVS